MARILPLDEKESSMMILPTTMPSPSLLDIDNPDENVNISQSVHTRASVHLHKGELPEILQDIYECPLGLESLAEADFLTVQTQFDPEDVLMGYDSDYRYQILNEKDERIYLAGKISRWRKRNIFWRSNAYQIHVMNFEGDRIVSITCTSSCCRDNVDVVMEDGLLGRLDCRCKLFPTVEINDDEGKLILQAKMIGCPCCSCYSGPAKFIIKICGTKNVLGRIEKLDKTDSTAANRIDKEHYSVHFRKDINVRVKVMLLAALFHVGIRFLNTRYETCERRVHAEKVQDDTDADVVNAFADDNASAGSDTELKTARKESDKEDAKVRKDSDKEKSRKDSGKEQARKDSEQEQARKDSDKDKARKDSENAENTDRKFSGKEKGKAHTGKSKHKASAKSEKLALEKSEDDFEADDLVTHHNRPKHAKSKAGKHKKKS